MVTASGNIQEGGGNEVKYVSPIPTQVFSTIHDNKTEICDDNCGVDGNKQM